MMKKRLINIYKTNEEIINYVIVGGCTTLVSIGSKWLLLFTILDRTNAFQLQLSVIISWICAVSFAYIANRIFVFKSKSKKVFKEVVSFFSARIVTLLLEMLIMWFFVTLLKLDTKEWVMFFTIISQFIILILNYIFSKVLVFKK